MDRWQAVGCDDDSRCTGDLLELPGRDAIDRVDVAARSAASAASSSSKIARRRLAAAAGLARGAGALVADLVLVAGARLQVEPQSGACVGCDCRRANAETLGVKCGRRQATSTSEPLAMRKFWNAAARSGRIPGSERWRRRRAGATASGVTPSSQGRGRERRARFRGRRRWWRARRIGRRTRRLRRRNRPSRPAAG